MQRRSVKNLVQKLLTKILFFELSVLVVLIALAVMVVGNFKREMAGNIADTFRTPLMVGDNRYTVMEMPGPALKYFSGVSWDPPLRANRFSIPDNLGQPNPMLYRRLTVPLFSDEARTIPAGSLHFYYKRWAFIGWAVTAWTVFLLASLPLVLHEKNRLIRDYRLTMELQVKESTNAMAAQVAHDIRSPLAALDMAVKSSAHIPEDQRIILRSAASRIRDIANNLLEKNREAGSAASAEEPCGTWLLSALIDPLLTEKRLQFRSRSGVQIDARLDAASYGLFAMVQPSGFKRVISNLVNNAVEAIDGAGRVCIGLKKTGAEITVTVTDNGKGIPGEVLEKLGLPGETHGKSGGSGLGLYHARLAMESWGGRLELDSPPGGGTTAALTLPAAPPPDWFLSVLALPAGSAVLVLDDDPSIHQLWQGRFEEARAKEYGIEEFQFCAPAELRAWVKANPRKAAEAVCLFDYELLGYTETGLSLAEELGLTPRTILVTSRYEEPRVTRECSRLGIPLIPKGLSDIVPISILQTDRAENHVAPAAGPAATAVLLDDDPLVHMTWLISAKAAGIALKAYEAPAELLKDSDSMPLNTPVYIDSNLGGGVKGEDIAHALHEKGFTDLYMQTGHPASVFADLRFLKGVQNKKPPWQ